MRHSNFAVCVLFVRGGFVAHAEEMKSARSAAPATSMVMRKYVDETRRNWEGTVLRPLTQAIRYHSEASANDSVFGGARDRNAFGPCCSSAMLMWLRQRCAAQGFVAAANHYGDTGFESKCVDRANVHAEVAKMAVTFFDAALKPAID